MNAILVGWAASAVHSQTPSMATCPLDPGLVEVKKRCDRGDDEPSPETCTVLQVLELLSRGEKGPAEEILTRELALPEASKERMMPWLQFFGGMAIDLDDSPTECTQAQGQRMLELVGAGLYESLREPEALVLLGRSLGWSETVMTHMEKRLDPAAVDAVNFVTRTVGELLQSAQAGPMLIEGLRSHPALRVMAGQLPDSAAGPENGGDEGRQQIDAALDLVRERKVTEAREAVTGALKLTGDATHQAKLLMRAGIGFLAAGFLEDGLDYLRQADTRLTTAPETTDPEAPTVRAMARWFHALAYDELGLPGQEGRVAASAEQLVDGEVGEILDVLGRSFLRNDRASSAAAVQLVADKVSSGEVEAAELRPLMDVFKEVVPGLDFVDGSLPAVSADGPSYIDYVLQIGELLIQERFQEAGAAAEELIDRFPRYNNVYWLALIAAKQWLAGDHTGALSNCHIAIEALETKVEGFRVDELQTAFVDDKVFLAFRLAIEIAGQAGRAEEAFEYAERLRAWTLRRLLGGPRLRSGGSFELGADEEELLGRIRGLERELNGTEQKRSLQQDLDDARAKFAARRLERKLDAAEESDLARVGAVTVRELQSEILAPDTTLLAYAAGLDDLWAWVVDRDSIEMVLLPLSEEEQRQIALLSQGLRQPGASLRGTELLAGDGSGEGDPATLLYSKLIHPVAEHLRHQNLIVVPHGLLHHLPFAALRHPDSGRYLVEDFVLSLAPSVSTLKLIQRPETVQGAEVLVLGDPVTDLGRLDAARREAASVAEFLGTEPYLEKGATEATVHAHSGHIGLLHLAAHGQYVVTNPIFSRIVLGAGDGHDGVLEVHEVWDRLNLAGNRLVALSGCQTALGELTRGDEVIGLTQAFLVAGSRAVLSTLWSVDDEASEKLMVAFYRRFLGGTPAAEALRGAQREMLRNPRYSAPYFWAGYTLTGDPGMSWLPAVH